MCDQTELKYVDGDIVWVKFSSLWWPGEVHGESRLPPDLLKSLRKMPIAVVKFFQENAYEYVTTINHIYRYNCIRKNEFIKKGLDLHRAKKRNMEKFPEDVRIAEEKTGGDPDIVDSEEFQPEKKPNIANIFGDQTPKMKKGFGRGRRKATPSEEDLTYSRTKNLSLKSAHATPTLSTPKSYTTSTLTLNRTPSTPSTSTPNANEFRCHLCNFSTTRLNVIVLHNKTHASETKIEPQPAVKAKKTPIATPIKKSPGRPRGRKPKQTPVVPVQLEIVDSAPEESVSQTSDSESDRKKVTPKKAVKAAPKKRQPKQKSTVPPPNVETETEEIVSDIETPVPKATYSRKAPRSTRRKQIAEIVPVETEQAPEEPIEIKSKLLADWSEEDDDSMVSMSKEVALDLEEIKSAVSSPTQSGDEKQPKQTIRNIPKKDRRNIILEEFYAKQVPSTTGAESEPEADRKTEREAETEKVQSEPELDAELEQEEQGVEPEPEHVEEVIVKDDIQIIELDDDACEIIEEIPKESEIGSTTDDKSNESIEIIPVEEIDSTADNDEVVESSTDVTADEIPAKENESTAEDLDLLKKGADLLEETSLLQKNIENVGIIEKKRRLLNKHKNDEDSENNETARSSSIEENIEETEKSAVEPDEKVPLDKQQDNEPVKERRRSSAKAQQIITPTVTKTYRSNSRRKTKSSSADEKMQVPSNDNEKDSIKGNGTETLPEIVEDVEMKSSDLAITTDDQTDIECDVKSVEKMEIDETSPTKSDSDPSKADVDCFDFKEEEEDIPQTLKTLNRRKRRVLPPGKVFELQTIDKLEEIRKHEENEKAKRIKLESDDKELIVLTANADDVKNISSEEEKLAEKQQKDDEVKDSKALPPKERGKRIFKSRNRSRLSEGDSFSNDEKSPTKDANQSFDSIEKSVADSTIESPKNAEIAAVKAESETLQNLQNESVAKEEINSTVKSEESRIESEVANTLITLTNSPIKMPEPKVTESIVTSSEKDASDEVHAEKDESSPKEKTRKISTNAVKETELPTSSKNVQLIEEVKTTEPEQRMEIIVSSPPVTNKRKSIETESQIQSDNIELPAKANQPLVKQVKTTNVVETSLQNANKRTNIPESSSQTRDAGDGLLIKSSPNVIVPKVQQPPASEVSAVSSTSTSPQQPQKKPPRSTRKKVAVTIGYDLQGNPIITYRKPSDKPVVHLPSHIQTPDMVQSVNPALLQNVKNPAQFVITSKGSLLKTTSNTTISQTPTTAISGRPLTQVVRSSASTSYSAPIRSPPMPTIHVQPQHSINPHLIHKQPTVLHKTNQQIQKHQFIQHQLKPGQVKQKITTNIVQHTQPMVQKQNVNVRAQTSRANKKQQEMLIRKQQESVITTHSQPDESQTEVLQNAEDSQLLAVPAESFSGPAGAFYLCRITETGQYEPIDNQPLYLDEKNQLIPGSLLNAGIQEELIEETLPQQQQQQQQFEYEQTQIVQNVDESANLKYLLNVDGQQILLDQQSLLQLTSGGEMQHLVTEDGQRLILQGSTQDILAAIQSNQQGQIILPEGMMEDDANNHDILAAALEDTGVFPQEQYIGDVLQIQTGNGIETVDPLAFQTINQAPTSETNAILPPIMSTLEQPSKSDIPSPNCSNLDESLAVIGVSVPSTNVPTSLELPITVTNPAIAPKTTNAIATIYPSNMATTIPPQALQTSQLTSDILNAAAASTIISSSSSSGSGSILKKTIVLDGAKSESEAVLMQDDESSEIVPNTPESVINHGFTSDNSNSSEIPLQSNLILRPPSIASMENDEAEQNVEGDQEPSNNRPTSHNNNSHDEQHEHHHHYHNQHHHHDQTENPHAAHSRTDVVDSLILNENSFDHHDAALLLANSRPGFRAVTVDNHQTNPIHINRNSRRNRRRLTNHSNTTNSSSEPDAQIFIIEPNIMGNSEYDTDDVANVEQFNS